MFLPFLGLVGLSIAWRVILPDGVVVRICLCGARDKQEEGEDIMDMDRIDADYVAIPELDTYDDADLDRREYDNMEHSDRRAAERELAKR